MFNFPIPGLLVVLGGAFIGGFAARQLKQPIIFGYLLAGLLISGLTERLGLSRESLGILAEIGLALLMFSLGLEFSLKKIERLKKVAFGGATSQIILTILIGAWFLEKFFGLPFPAAFIAASAFSLSSTAIVVKILSEKARLESLPGEIMFGWLLVQDLAVLPLISLLPVLFNGSDVTTNLLTMGKAVVILLLTWLAAGKIVPKFADLVSSLKNRELLLLFAVAVVFLFALLSANFGFSFGLGAFLAGLILSQTPAHFAVFSEVRPLRDVFLAVFFVSLGLSLEPSFFLTFGPQILLISFCFLFLKVLLTALILICFGYHAQTIFSCSFGLAQVGEFSFVLAATALAGGFIDKETYFLIVSVALLTMVLTPWFFLLAEKLYWQANRLSQRWPALHDRFFAHLDRRLPLEELPFEKHVVILGYGRVGKWVGAILDKVKVPYIVVEYNPEVVRELKLLEKPVVFGDPTELDVLDLAQVDKAKLVVIALPDPLTQRLVMANCQVLNPRALVICRSHLEEDGRELKALGVDQIIQPEFEAALSMGHRILQHFGYKKDDINLKIREVKKEHETVVSSK
jgi:CPA2 family monovalent cation:H+ antiporter-2